MRICSIEGCGKKHKGHGYCNKHWLRLRIHGDPTYKPPTIHSRIIRKVLSENQDPNVCWVWPGATNGIGYGMVGFNGKNMGAHRAVYRILVGPIPEGFTLDHLCRNPICVNPHHLEPVSMRDNILRGVSPAAKQARQTHCKRGHELTDRRRRGKRQCLLCVNELERERYKNDEAYREKEKASAIIRGQKRRRIKHEHSIGASQDRPS